MLTTCKRSAVLVTTSTTYDSILCLQVRVGSDGAKTPLSIILRSFTVVETFTDSH